MRYDEILDRIAGVLNQHHVARAIVAAPYSSEVIDSINEVYDLGYLSEVVLIGDPEKMPATRRHFRVLEALSLDAVASLAADEAGKGCCVVVKGNISSSTLLRAILKGGGPGALANHVYIINSKAFPNKAVLVSDAGVNIHPDLNAKAKIIGNTVRVAQAVGLAEPKVALLSAVETINTAMPCTIDAAALKVMGERGVFGTALIDGPMALDAAMLPRAAQTKGLRGDVAGNADVLILDDIEAGNSTAKALIGADGDAMGVIVGANTVVAFPSRGDSPRTRIQSLMLAAFLTASEAR